MSTGVVVHDDRDTIIAGLRAQLQLAREELAAERARESGVEEGVAQLRSALAPLKEGLDRIFGMLPEVASSVSSSTASPRTSAIWEDWKTKFPGHGARAIDALLLHGSMTQTQLRIAIGTRSSGTITNIVGALNKAGIINKRDGKISLKEL